MEPNSKETLRQVSDATLQEPLTITVDIRPQGKIHGRLQTWGVRPKQRVFLLAPITLGSLIRISKLLLGIHLRLPGQSLDGKEGALLQMNYEAIEKHTEQMAEIIAIAFQNNRQPASKSMVNFIMENFTTHEMQGVLALVLQQMDLTNFMRSIISVKGLNVLENGKPAPATIVNGSGVSL